MAEDAPKKLSLIAFSGDFDKAVAAFTMASGAAAVNYEVHVFFTFWGLNIIKATKGRAFQGRGALAGAFNFQPGRTMQQALIPGAEPVGYAIIAAVLVWAFLPLLRTGGDSGRVA